MADGAAEETQPDDAANAEDGGKLPEEDTLEESKEETPFLTEGEAQSDQVITNFENADKYGGEQEHEDERKEL